MPVKVFEAVKKCVWKDFQNKQEFANHLLMKSFDFAWYACIKRMRCTSLDSAEKDRHYVFLFCENTSKNSPEKREMSINLGYEIQIQTLDGEKEIVSSEEHCFEKSSLYHRTGFIDFERFGIDKIGKDLNIEIKIHIENRFIDFEANHDNLFDGLVQGTGINFHVQRSFLAMQSEFFKSAFFGKPDGSEKSKLSLHGVDSYDFQNYLEVLYGGLPLTDSTVNGVLQLADRLLTPSVQTKCEEFLKRDSRKTLKEKYELAVQYKMEGLKDKCVAEVVSPVALSSMMPENLEELEKSDVISLLKKSMNLHRRQECPCPIPEKRLRFMENPTTFNYNV